MELSKELKCWRAACPDEWKMEEFASQAKELEQENAKLKAQLENTRLGLEKLEKLLKYDDFELSNSLDYQDDEWCIFQWQGECLCHAPTLADLIDQVALMEVE